MAREQAMGVVLVLEQAALELVEVKALGQVLVEWEQEQAGEMVQEREVLEQELEGE